MTTAADGSSVLRRIEAKPFALVVAEIRLRRPLDGVTTMRLAGGQRTPSQMSVYLGVCPDQIVER